MYSPHDLALAYDRHVAALWREESETARVFATWLAAFWVEGGPPEPVAYPDAVSFLGAAGRGIRWYRLDTDIIGYLPGCPNGCYRVPATVTPSAPAFAPAPGNGSDAIRGPLEGSACGKLDGGAWSRQRPTSG